ncbi:E3 ubiquitin-protein ligase TRIM56-like [Ruditapes philippinarum]|uniref:E3 ubiquitin-protein ligase TRIM56-like n=1 Tax=Ruditapes philippinarum TaxID=129788 RepID=UPI00295C2B06|nr:E3 ubiquitin-protein ligase TRIM56-like [Ruditapes philippinarum]
MLPILLNECAICNETLKNPKLLSCNHTYCELCINTWISKSKKNSGIECPLCRQVTPPPKPCVGAAFWASMLPDLTAGKEIDVLCKPCESIQERNAAKFYCLECKEYMCVFCRVSHTKFKVLKSHRTVELDSHDENSIQSFKEYSKLLMCDLHPVKEIEFFCEDDDALFCSTCAFLHHRSCYSVKEIKADYAEIKTVKPLSAISKNLKTIRKKVEEVSAFHNKNNELLVKNEREITAKLKASEQNILRSLKSFHGEVITKLNEKNRPYKTTNDEKIKICCEIIENLKRAENTAKDTMGVASGSAEYVIMSRRLEKRYDEIQNQIETHELSTNTSNKYMFEFNEDFFRSLNQIETYGCYKETKCPRLIIEFSTTVNKSNFVPTKAMKISSKLARRKTYFPSACYMFDDKEERVVLAD